MAPLQVDLQELLREPRERLEVELKGWLDVTKNGPKGTLAKTLLAMANHGGGFVVIGFEDDGTASAGRPANLDAYTQDAINDVIDRFGDPGFHCTVHHVTRAADKLVYPVVIVPGGHKVPIRSKRGTEGNEIQIDRYYVRRPGPASETPQSGHEWDELIRRCVRNNTDEIASLVRDVLEGRAPKAEPKPDTAGRLEEWQKQSVVRWGHCVAAVPKDGAARFPRGWYSVSYLVEDVNL